ncbi:MAG: rRNA maturation RNase YbeY [Phycisphaerae bacterium]
MDAQAKDDDGDYNIAVTRQVEVPADLDDGRIILAVETTLRHCDCQDAKLEFALVDDQAIAELNQRYLNHTGPTDVLSFDLGDDRQGGVEGQIVASIQTAERQARQHGHSVQAEIILYCVHGTLHLLGYDDHEPDQAARMHRLEDELLTQLGWGPVYAAGRP